MTSKKLGRGGGGREGGRSGSLLMKLALSISYYFSKTDLCLPLQQRFEKAFAHESKY